jgi:hypothetical protein
VSNSLTTKISLQNYNNNRWWRRGPILQQRCLRYGLYYNNRKN